MNINTRAYWNLQYDDGLDVDAGDEPLSNETSDSWEMTFCMSSVTVCMFKTLSVVSRDKFKPLSTQASQMKRFGMPSLDCLDGHPLSFMCLRGMLTFSLISSLSLPTFSVSGKYSVNFSFKYSMLNANRR